MFSASRFIYHFVCLILLGFSVSNTLGQSSRERSEFAIVPDEQAMAAKHRLLNEIPPIGTGESRPPNIVLILADDLGYEDTAVYGSKSIPTPHIDALASHGVRFTNAYVTAATCSPSRAGLMSGRYQQRFGFEFNTSSAKITHDKSRGLRPSVVTMAEVLQKAGYATGMFGKWHLGTREYFRPQQRGFDEFYGFLAGAHSFFPAEKPQPIYQSIMRGDKRLIEEEYLTDAIAREAVAFIENKKDQPFFAYVPFNAVHTPIEASEKYQERFPNEKNPIQRDFNAMVSSLDDAVGRIVGTLEKYDLKENTLVLFMDDNGGPMYTKVQSNGPLRMGKLFLFEGGVRVPMILSWPGNFDGGMVFRGTTSSLDVFPTVCAAAGISIPDTLELDGVDLGPYLIGESKGSPHRSLAWSNGPNKAFRQGKWKIIKSGDHTWLFDLSKDVGERINIAAENPETVQRLQKALDKWLGEMAPPAWPSKPTRRIVDIDGIPYEQNI